MSNLVSLQETAGYHITFLPKYILSTDPLLKQPDDELHPIFFQGIRLMFPELKQMTLWQHILIERLKYSHYKF